MILNSKVRNTYIFVEIATILQNAGVTKTKGLENAGMKMQEMASQR